MTKLVGSSIRIQPSQMLLGPKRWTWPGLISTHDPAPHWWTSTLEAATLDDVGPALQRHHDNGVAISMDLGTHSNDEMKSFYGPSPSGVDVEFGFGGRIVDESTWVVAEITKPSLWGHRAAQPAH